MTVSELMTLVDTLHPNQFTAAQKLLWLNQVEQTIWHKIIETHESDLEDMPSYSDASSADTLLAEDPYSRLYPLWMDAQIAYYNRESLKYESAATAFNAAYEEYRNWYNRSHMPVGTVNHLHLLDRRWA